MIPVICRVKHDPPNSYGDCLRASVASILEYDAEYVPHFLSDGTSDGDLVVRRLRSFLDSVGFKPVIYGMDGSHTLDEILMWTQNINPGIYFLLFGRTLHGEHVVIVEGGRIAHDTAWFKSPLIGPNTEDGWLIMTFAPLAICKK